MPETHTQEQPGSTLKSGPVDQAEELEEVRVLRVQPGDIIVCHLHSDVDQQELEQVYDRLKERFPDNQVTVLGKDVKLSITRPSHEDQLARLRGQLSDLRAQDRIEGR